MNTKSLLSHACFFSLVLIATFPALATDQQDLSVALKTLPLLTKKIASPATIAVIYDPANAELRDDANGIKSMIDSGIEAPGDVKLIARLVSTGELTGLSGSNIAFLARQLPHGDYEKINNATSAGNILTICTDVGCVKENLCILGIVSQPQVEVYYSPAAADRASISFAPAFTMLAKQVGSM